MRIGFIGAGTVGKTIARHFITAGHQVVISNARGSESLQGLVGELGPLPEPAARKKPFSASSLSCACNGGTHRRH